MTSYDTCALACGNGRIDGDEECDTGSDYLNKEIDGCDEYCKALEGFNCTGVSNYQHCPAICGDGK